MYQFLPDFVFAPQGELSDDEEGRWLILISKGKKLFVSIKFIDEDEDDTKREKKSRPARHTDTNRRRNTENSTVKPRQIASEYQKPVCC